MLLRSALLSSRTLVVRSKAFSASKALPSLSHALSVAGVTNDSPLQSHNMARYFSNKKSMTQLIKELRASTGAPMVECKKALSAEGVDGDIEKATDWLRQHGSAKASSKVSGREASEGLVGLLLSPDGGKASLVKVASETDFAGRSSAFAGLVEDVAQASMSLTSASGDGSIDVEGDELLNATVGDSSTVKAALDEAILAIRENLQLSEVKTFVVSDDDAILAGYVHGRVPDSTIAGSAAAVVEIAKTGKKDITKEEMQDAGKKLAMHAVAARPTYLSPETVPEDIVEKERAILMEQMADSGKPANILEKIIDGRMRKFYEGICLTEQAHMVEEKNPKVSKVLSELGLKATRFDRTSVQ